jgi:uncharacterized protein YqfA (UPF0365 family)
VGVSYEEAPPFEETVATTDANVLSAKSDKRLSLKIARAYYLRIRVHERWSEVYAALPP